MDPQHVCQDLGILLRASDNSCLPPSIWKLLGWAVDQGWLSSHIATKWHRIVLGRGVIVALAPRGGASSTNEVDPALDNYLIVAEHRGGKLTRSHHATTSAQGAEGLRRVDSLIGNKLKRERQSHAYFRLPLHESTPIMTALCTHSVGSGRRSYAFCSTAKGEIAVVGFQYDSMSGLRIFGDGQRHDSVEGIAKMVNTKQDGVRGVTCLQSSGWELVAGTAEGQIFIWDGAAGARTREACNAKPNPHGKWSMPFSWRGDVQLWFVDAGLVAVFAWLCAAWALGYR